LRYNNKKDRGKMDKFKLAGICVLTSSLALSGCVTRNYNLTPGQEFSSSTQNRGYITRQVPEPKENKAPHQIIKKPIMVNEMEMESIISVFSEAIKNNPKYAGAYYNRAIAYFYKDNYE
jgi:hypothetical protein